MHPDLAGALARQSQEDRLKHLSRRFELAGAGGALDRRPSALPRVRQALGHLLVSAGSRLAGQPLADRGADRLPGGVVVALGEPVLREPS